MHKTMDLKDTLHAKQRGKFRIRPSSGVDHMLLSCCYATNAILVCPSKSRKGPMLVETITDTCTCLLNRRHEPRHQILDNEASHELKLFLKNNKATFQLVPPNYHRKNASERCMRTFKNHLISILCGVHPNFPLNQHFFINAPVHVVCSIFKHVMGSASESETSGAHVNARGGIFERTYLMEMDHPQEATSLQLDNTTAHGIITEQLMPRRSKSIDMRFYWTRDRTH